MEMPSLLTAPFSIIVGISIPKETFPMNPGGLSVGVLGLLSDPHLPSPRGAARSPAYLGWPVPLLFGAVPAAVPALRLFPLAPSPPHQQGVPGAHISPSRVECVLVCLLAPPPQSEEKHQRLQHIRLSVGTACPHEEISKRRPALLSEGLSTDARVTSRVATPTPPPNTHGASLLFQFKFLFTTQKQRLF